VRVPRCIMPYGRDNFKVSPGEGAARVEGQVIGALGTIGAATLASRVLGYVRDMVVALAFGAGPVTDAFFVAFRIPNILRRLLGEGALSTAVVPVFTEYAATRPRPELDRMLRAVLAGALLALVVTTVLGIVGAPWLVRLVAPGFAGDPAQLDLAVLLTRVMFPYLVLVGLAALAMGALHSQGRFFAAALGPAVLNVGMIAGIVVLATRLEPPILSLAVGVLVGGVGQLLVQVPSLRACRLPLTPSRELDHPALLRVGRLLVPAVFGLAAVQVMVFVNTLLASLLPSGAISFLYYADRVMEFPLGVFGIALASASLPAMSRQAATGDVAGVAATLNLALRLAVFISVPASVALIVLRTPIVQVLFERGRFGPDDTVATAAALASYGVGLVGFAGARIAAQSFYAIGQPGLAVRLGVVAVAVNIVAAVSLMGPMGHTGLALASSIGAWTNLVALMWTARRRLGPLGGRALAASAARTVVASTPLVAWCWLAVELTLPARTAGTLTAAGWLAGVVAGGIALFWVASAVVRAPERTALERLLPWGRAR
jgi:putative peptidoglycan lipid II flippase